MLKGKNILIGVTGGIAAYKIPMLVRELKKARALVKIVMTDAAKEFVSPLALSTLSCNEVIVGSFSESTLNVIKAGTWHIELAQWANIMLIAPATANTIAKLANGYADNAVTTLTLAMRCPVIVSPSMDVDMWQREITQSNVSKLREFGYIILPPESGELASGLVGQGRLPDLLFIQKMIEKALKFEFCDLRGKKILVTAGPTHEDIDPIRYIGNRSSGKMGFAIATAAVQRGAEVTLISGKTVLRTPRNINRIDVKTAEQMYNAVVKHNTGMDAVIMAAAVSDFTPVKSSLKKIKKENLKEEKISIELKKTKDILKHIGNLKKRNILVGFAVETDNEISNAKKKLKEKNLDLIVLNNPNQEGAGFETDTNIVTVISKAGKVERLKKMSKFEVAQEILTRVANLL